MNSNIKISFIGSGNMAISLIKGLLASGFPAANIIATDPTESKRQSISQTLGIACLEDNASAVAQSDIIVLAIKPQVLQNVCTEVCDATQQKNPLIISVAAGVRATDIVRWLGGKIAVVRCMPNTPAMIQSGATGLYANEFVSEEQKSQAENILRAVGITVWVNTEADLDTVTAVSGSGPAYYFLFMEAMQKAAQGMGLSEQAARILTIQTAFGAAKMALESSDDCSQLRKNVTSPNGTTEKAIQSFENNRLEDIVAEAMMCAKLRAETLADELSDCPPPKKLEQH
ncbi:pyrroline-5-carboxylate reductase [Hydrogenovibrio sp. JE_KL2]|uniref:pyrroline-5-carboxylate reductase n=1 Tax=Hydrogenovibrio sp. JE_KL2 TaxID=2651188 RepID=UPI00128CFEBB|nr:pyrroline-5-carboxylate reductase [Hydrogenovibrio sp. JE_KL2]MPQ77527.1 pyrroline-5-carboxylate reductase [Hydrogenovibrio sp. JE_KL2]